MLKEEIFKLSLHYIHTPRCDKAFGFYLEDEMLHQNLQATVGVEIDQRKSKQKNDHIGLV